jgi:ABC-2 type transport system permease protein
MTGSIYDLGYRRYDGPRLGRRHAVASLVRHSLRSVLGLGRGGRAKLLPAICIGMPAIIALLLIGVRALAARGGLDSSQIVPGHEGLYPTIWVFPVLFVAAQAPELLGRDQRYRVLTLYFSRALRRPDYALGKLVALSLGVFAILFVPHLVMSVGSILLTANTSDAIGKELGVLPAIVGSSAVIGIVASALALAISSFTPRRAYATAAIFGAFIVPGIVAAIVIGLDLGTASQSVVLLDVGALLDGANAWFFGVDPSTAAAVSGISTEILLIGSLVLGGLSIATLVARYQRIVA